MNEYYENLYDTILKKHLWPFVRTGFCPECNSPAEYEVTVANDFETKKETRHIWTFGKRVAVINNDGKKLYGYRGHCKCCGTEYLFLYKQSFGFGMNDYQLYKYSDFRMDQIFTEVSKDRMFMISDLAREILWMHTSHKESWSDEEYSKRLLKLYYKYTKQTEEYKNLDEFFVNRYYESVGEPEEREHDPYEFHELHE